MVHWNVAPPRFFVGDVVVVARGVKVPRGVIGKIIWLGHGKYHPEWGMRVGIKTDDGAVYWTALKNVDPLEVPYDPRQFSDPVAADLEDYAAGVYAAKVAGFVGAEV
jgi:hypothetical protein